MLSYYLTYLQFILVYTGKFCFYYFPYKNTAATLMKYLFSLFHWFERASLSYSKFSHGNVSGQSFPLHSSTDLFHSFMFFLCLDHTAGFLLSPLLRMCDGLITFMISVPNAPAPPLKMWSVISLILILFCSGHWNISTVDEIKGLKKLPHFY